MQVLMSIIQYLFSRKKTLVYTAVSTEDYFAVVNLLRKDAVPYRTATLSQETPLVTHADLGCEYKIYVEKKNKHKAERALARRGVGS